MIRRSFTCFALSAVLALGAGLTSGPAHAGDCKRVKFEITNNMPSRIKVTTISIEGNDGNWTENIGNKKINAGGTHKTNGRRLNKLDSGEVGTFSVNFRIWDAPNNRWAFAALVNRTVRWRCRDGITIPITVSPQS